jgi:hypothetical protein
MFAGESSLPEFNKSHRIPMFVVEGSEGHSAVTLAVIMYVPAGRLGRLINNWIESFAIFNPDALVL